jgi:N4-gp56 family major capsid protein
MEKFTGLNYDPGYTDSANKGKSSIDYASNSDQMNTFYWLRRSLTDAKKESYFTQLADTIGMPKHFGKKIKLYHYIPLLDDRNVNDQGIDAKGVKCANGNLYGSSRDIGTIKDKLPVLGEGGGRVNRVGFSRVELEGTFAKFGVFREWSRESFEFDSDSELRGHLSRELMTGMVQMQEAMLQIDLLEAAGVQVFPGTAVSKKDVTGEGDTPTIIDYETLRRADQILDENRCPRNTKYISGSRNVDTKTINSARIAYVSSAVVPLLEDMKDKFGNKVWVPVQQYAAAGSVLHGEVGSIGHFRFIQVPEMLDWEGAGAAVTKNPGYREKDGKYSVFPILIVGSESFNTIGFNFSSAKDGKFSIITKVPGRDTATKEDPYGETGFSSLKFYYGFLAKRPERICVIHTVAPE